MDRLIKGAPLRCRRLAVALAALMASGIATPAGQPFDWRIFTAQDGLSDSYALAITWSPRGNVWVRHLDSYEISVMDGYSIETLPSPGRENYRVYESRTGQLWSLYQDGLVLYAANQWAHFFVPEIRSEIQSQMLRRVRQIPLVPAEHNRVFFLLSDRLMQFDPAQKARVLKRVEQTGLGKFIEMTEARDGGLWITGAKGLAKVAGPIRQISSDSEWRVEIISERLGVANLQRPFEDGENGIATVASDTQGSNQRALLQFDGADWVKTSVPDENILQAWPGWDDRAWAYTINSLLFFEGGRSMGWSKERVGVGQHRDVAIEPGGVFWLATSEGVVRYAPHLWRTPRTIEQVDSPVHAALETPDGTIWFASTDALIQFRDDTWRIIGWPPDFESEFQIADHLYWLQDGRLVIAGGDRGLLFNPGRERFEYVSHPSGRHIRFVGRGREGSVWAQTSAGSRDSEAPMALEQFDGDRFIPMQTEPDVDVSQPLDFAVTVREDAVWFGTAGEIALLHKNESSQYAYSGGFYGYRASSCLVIDESRVWFGSEGKILEYADGKRNVVRTGLGRIHRMYQARSGAIWVATSEGLFKFSNGSWVSNASEEGLPAPTATEVLEDQSGRLWAGTTRGISLYHPNADLDSPDTYPPESANSQAGSSAEGLTVFRLRGIDKWNSTRAGRLLYSFRIDEGQWSSFTNATRVSFENLRAGKHRFEVRAMDRNWNQDPVPAFLDFSVAVPWTKEPRILGVLAGGLALVLFFAGLAVNRHLRLIRSYAEVERIVGVRTRELEKANQELIHSQKMRALGTLAAGISHDFNNILSIIKGSAQLIESNIDDKEKIRNRISRIKTMVDQGTGVVKSILGLSRATEQDLKPCDLNALISATIRLLDDQLLRKVSIAFEPDSSLPRVLGVEAMIQQMLLNLLLNAVDAMSGVGEIMIRSSQSSRLPADLPLPPIEAETHVLIKIQDSGCGIEAELLPRVFEPFFTTKSLSTRRGTGLGLTMVYELAKEIGFGLHVESEAGKGTLFTIIAPVR